MAPERVQAKHQSMHHVVANAPWDDAAVLEAVQKAGLAEALQPRWIFGESVRQVLNYVARGEVDAGFVYRTDARIERDKTRIAFTAPTTTPVRYPIAAIAASKNAEGAQQFIRFVRSPAGGEILERFGFSKP